jgi:hypothetical protein
MAWDLSKLTRNSNPHLKKVWGIYTPQRRNGFGELNDKAIKGLMNLSEIVSRFPLYIHEQPLKYLNMDVYYGSH